MVTPKAVRAGGHQGARSGDQAEARGHGEVAERQGETGVRQCWVSALTTMAAGGRHEGVSHICPNWDPCVTAALQRALKSGGASPPAQLSQRSVCVCGPCRAVCL